MQTVQKESWQQVKVKCKTLKRSECAVLPLVLKGKWYDMIERGEKTEEYREKTPYWKKRILRWIYSRKYYNVVAFSRGYRKASMFFWAACSFNTHIGFSKGEWGEPAEEHYKIFLLERVELVEDGGGRRNGRGKTRRKGSEVKG